MKTDNKNCSCVDSLTLNTVECKETKTCRQKINMYNDGKCYDEHGNFLGVGKLVGNKLIIDSFVSHK